ncbi:hypothetical protein [Cellulomonas sp. RIT-PI-Y]|uniref:hypothetical protein n=1 Tax=Cellulomonas sp. RIT-PI-Y TaxID=3035297 RepID=UPI0021DA7F32|nr:hypothetical protein [Cellulomonas sp. RIT-PI-Y]
MERDPDPAGRIDLGSDEPWVLRVTGTADDRVVRAFAGALAPGGDLRDAVRHLAPVRTLDLREADELGDLALDLVGVLMCHLTPGYSRLTVLGAVPAVRRRLVERGLDALITFSAGPGT